MSRSSLVFLALAACSTTFNGGTDPAAVAGSAAEATELAPVSLRLRMGTPMQRFDGAEPAPEGCLDESEGGVRGEAVATGLAVKVRSLTLKGAEGTPDVKLLAEVSYEEAEWVELTEEGVEVEAAEIPLGTYEGIEMGLWAVQAELPMRLPELGEGEHDFTMWFGSEGYTSPRDVTVEMDEAQHWIDLETGSLVEVPKEAEQAEAPDTGDTGFADFEVDPYGVAPSERLRMRDDGVVFAEDPALLSSADGTLPFESDSGEATVTLATGVELAEGIEVDMTVLELTFLPIDSMTWWEGPVGKVEADGVYDPMEDCGLDVAMPGVVATATVGGEMPEIPEEADTGAWDTAAPAP
jgi:hypothetical protein